MRRAFVLLVAASLLAGGCGSNQANEVLAETAVRLGGIHSGNLSVKLLVQPHGLAGSQAFGFEEASEYPVRIPRVSLIPDSEGAGKFRGGLGVRRDYWFPTAAPRCRHAWATCGKKATRSCRRSRPS